MSFTGWSDFWPRPRIILLKSQWSTQLEPKPNLYICYRSKDPYVLSSPLISVYSDWSLDSYISERSIDPFISERSVNPYISERSIDPYIQTGQWIPIFLVGRLIPIFWPVHGSLYISERSVNHYIYERSVDPYILSGPWILIFWLVNESLYSDQSVDPYTWTHPNSKRRFKIKNYVSKLIAMFPS